MGISKFIYGGEVKMDLTGDTVTAEKLSKGATAHGRDGEPITGTNTFTVDASGATATEDEVLEGQTFGAGASMKTGSMKNRGAVNQTISTKDQKSVIPQGYHDGSGGVTIAPAEKAKLIPGNIKAGITLLGVVGSHSGADAVTAQEKTATPTTEQQIITPDPGTDYLSQVTVKPIPYKETPNEFGGITATVG